MGSPLRVATYNPQQFRSVDLLAVVGTCCTTDLQVERLGRGDRSTSIDLYINTRRFNKKQFAALNHYREETRDEQWPCTSRRVFTISRSVPSTSLQVSERKTLTTSSNGSVNGLTSVDRCLPLLCCDANAHVGFSRVPGVAAANVRTASAAIGGHNPARENYQGHVLRHFAERHFLALSNTFF